MSKSKTIVVKSQPIAIIEVNEKDYISLTDMIKSFGDDSIITNWLRNRNTIEFLGFWEQIYNPDFKPLEFEGIKKQAGLNSFWISPKKWVDITNATGLISRSGRYGGGTYAHKDIAFEFGSWLSPEFKLYLIKEFQRLKDEENERLKSEWNLQRTLSKINYRIHTDAIKEELLPPTLTREQRNRIYASEADVLNMALFGQTAANWREHNKNKEKPGLKTSKSDNIRDHAVLEQLVILTNLESINAVLIRQGLSQTDRLQKLNEIAISQMRSLLNSAVIKKLK